MADDGSYGLGPLAGNKARGQDVLDAAYNTVHNYPGGCKALAVRAGIAYTTLKHKVNPNNETHHLSLREAVTIQELTGNHSILHSMADALGYTCTRATPGNDQATPIDVMASLYAELGDLQRAVADALRDGKAVTGNEIRRVDYHAQETIAAITNVLAMLRARMRQAPESY